MPIPRPNYFPPAGSIVDRNEPRAQWNGRTWTLRGRAFSVPSSHSLVGRPGSVMQGWYYDWRARSWMQPEPPRPVAPPPMSPPRPMAPPLGPVRPVRIPRPSIVRGPVIRPMPQPPAVPERKEPTVEKDKKAMTPIESLMKHPVAPVIGGLLLLASHFTEEPQPPTIPADLPEPTAKQWQMIYNQNQQRFQRRMDMYQQLGMVLLGYASTQTVLDALPPKRTA